MQRNPSNWESLGNWYPYFTKDMGTFLPSDFHPMLYFITHEKMQQNAPCMGDLNSRYTLVRLPFFQQISALWYSTSRQKCMGFPINFSYHGSKIPSMGDTGISVPILLLSYRSFCSIKFPVYHWYIGFPTNFPRYG